MTNPWGTLLLLDITRVRYLRLGRPATVQEWWLLTSMAQEECGWTVVV